MDESPRYASIGRWEHTTSFSSWLSGDTYRPLPRREWSVRNDYQVLYGTNRHTVMSTGWLQEENNLKAVLTEDRKPAAEPYVGREYGLARYEAIRDTSFAAADAYYGSTRDFWTEVREQWETAFAAEPVITLRGPVDEMGLFMAADEVTQNNGEVTAETERRIEETLTDMGVQ